jgi:hypothetical protein
MANQYTGRMLYELTDTGYEVTAAVISPRKLSISWREDGDEGGITATSNDGTLYQGRYSYEQDSDVGSTDLILYRAKDGRVLLFGSWVVDGSGGQDRGPWLFQLAPADET